MRFPTVAVYNAPRPPEQCPDAHVAPLRGGIASTARALHFIAYRQAARHAIYIAPAPVVAALATVLCWRR